MTKQKTKKKAIIWDWNGTLLNDVDICITAMNIVLSRRNLKAIDRNIYADIFTFPVRNYYENCGFDFSREDFEVPAMEFIKLYHEYLPQAKLHSCANDVLENFKSLGLKQFVLSAMEHQSLLKSLEDNGIYNFFEHINGIDNHYAHSKLEMGKELLEKIPFEKNEILMIGDTLHDKDVSQGLGIDFVLVANGHQSEVRLRQQTNLVFNDLREVAELITNPNYSFTNFNLVHRPSE